MADYNIVIIKSRGVQETSFLMLVNGEVCRFNDYDYEDPDFARQQAMDRCYRMDLGFDLFNIEHSQQELLALCDVAPKLTVGIGWLLRADHQRQDLTGDELLEVSIHLGQNILKLNQPGECL